MNKLKISSVAFLLFSALFFNSCTDQNNNPVDPLVVNPINTNTNNNGTNTTAGAMTASVGGASFSSATNNGAYTTTAAGNQLSITGTTSDGRSISIQLLNPAVATFSASSNTSSLCILQYFDASLGANGIFSSTNTATNTSVGTVTLSSFDTVNNTVSGTFSFTGYNSLNATTTTPITTGVITNFSFANTVTTPSNPTASGDYLPLALNNVWNYTMFDNTIKDYKIISVDNIGGTTYYKLNHAITSTGNNPLISDSSVTVHLRKSNGDYFQLTEINQPETATSPGIVIQPFELLILKDYLAVGTTFTTTATQTTTTTFMGNTSTNTQTISYDITILGKGLTYTIGATTYTDVIKIKILNTDGSFTYDWFAKNIGWIKSEDYDSATTPQTDGLALSSYTLH